MITITLKTENNVLYLTLAEAESEYVFRVNPHLTDCFQGLLQKIILDTLLEFLHETDRLVDLELD